MSDERSRHDRPLNVCFVTRAMPAHGRGGMEDHTLGLASGVAARGHTVTVVTTGHPEKRCETEAGVEIHYLEGTRPRRYSRGYWQRSVETLRELHAERRFDLLHSQSIGAHAFLKRGLNHSDALPTIVSFHGTPYDEVVSRVNILRHSPSLDGWVNLYKIGYWTEQYLRFYRGAAARADAVIATSDEQEALIKRIFKVAPERVHKVYNGMDLGQFAPAPRDEALREQLGLPGDARVLLCVARFARDKGIDQVVRALPAILADEPRARLVLVGDGEQRKRLTRIVRRLGLEASVTFTGYVPFDALPRYFHLCELFINATLRRNGYDLTMLEAMACARVVVSSDIGSTPTLIQDGVNGVLVPVGDREALAARIGAALRDPDQTRAMGERARDRATSLFSEERMVAETIKVYQEVA